MYSLKLAIDELRSGRADAMLCGGLSRPDPLYTQMGFSQLRALSARGTPAPFDEKSDGLVVGEGAGMFVLKRLEDALCHGDHIYATVAGIGISNDIHGDLLAPSVEGQLRAMRMAYEHAGWAPTDVDLIECHATGTPVGDAVEIESLKSLWGADARQGQACVVGSAKSNIGHTLTAAGAAGLLKVLLAFQHQTLPPTANFERPAAKLGLAESPFRVLSRAEPWPERETGRPRRAAVSGFGFGGVNCHVLLEEWKPRETPLRAAEPPPSSNPARSARSRSARREPLAIVGLSSHFGPFAGRESFAAHVLGYPRRGGPSAPRNWWGFADPKWLEREGIDPHAIDGYYIDALEFGIDEFRIPPRELAEMLPQQSLMLGVAADAIRDAGWSPVQGLTTGVLIGIGLDLSATNYHLRWSLAGRASVWNETLGLGLSPEEEARWVDDLHASVEPALTANRTMGSLGGLIASRIAREFKIGGPSFTLSCDETSGIQALQIAADWLRNGELDAVVVGSIDFAGDLRAVLARERLRNDNSSGQSAACDGAVALVVKRLTYARRDGNHIYAVVDEIVASRSIADDSSRALNENRPPCERIESAEIDLGRAGAAAGLATVAKAALCLDHVILPGSEGANGARFWMRNRAHGPRRAAVSVVGLGGIGGYVELSECDKRDASVAPVPNAVPRSSGLVCDRSRRS